MSALRAWTRDSPNWIDTSCWAEAKAWIRGTPGSGLPGSGQRVVTKGPLINGMGEEPSEFGELRTVQVALEENGSFSANAHSMPRPGTFDGSPAAWEGVNSQVGLKVTSAWPVTSLRWAAGVPVTGPVGVAGPRGGGARQELLPPCAIG